MVQKEESEIQDINIKKSFRINKQWIMTVKTDSIGRNFKSRWRSLSFLSAGSGRLRVLRFKAIIT
jgi:hypothetical protein